MKLQLFALTLLVSTLGLGESLKVMGRDYTYSCGYFSSMVGDYDITFKDESLPWGTKVTLIYGWDTEQWREKPERKEWKYREEKVMKAVSPFTWSKQIETTLHSRTEAEFKKALNIVIKIEEPKQAVRYFNGGSPWGFFRTEVGNPSKAPCIDRDKKKPEFYDRRLEVVTRRD